MKEHSESALTEETAPFKTLDMTRFPKIAGAHCLDGLQSCLPNPAFHHPLNPVFLIGWPIPIPATITELLNPDHVPKEYRWSSSNDKVEGLLVARLL